MNERGGSTSHGGTCEGRGNLHVAGVCVCVCVWCVSPWSLRAKSQLLLLGTRISKLPLFTANVFRLLEKSANMTSGWQLSPPQQVGKRNVYVVYLLLTLAFFVLHLQSVYCIRLL